MKRLTGANQVEAILAGQLQVKLINWNKHNRYLLNRITRQRSHIGTFKNYTADDIRTKVQQLTLDEGQLLDTETQLIADLHATDEKLRACIEDRNYCDMEDLAKEASNLAYRLKIARIILRRETECL